MSDLLARLRSDLEHASAHRMLVVKVELDDLEALLVIAEQPAMSLTARPEPSDLLALFDGRITAARLANGDAQQGGYLFVGPEGAALAAEIEAYVWGDSPILPTEANDGTV